MGFMNEVLNLFGFTSKDHDMIGAVCILVLTANFLGGLMYSIILASGGPIRPRPTSQKISFRLSMASELVLVLFAAYYHAMMIRHIESAHMVYWVFTMAASPLLAVIGSQITGMVFQKKIESNKLAYKKWEMKQRAKRMRMVHKRAEQAERRPTKGGKGRLAHR